MTKIWNAALYDEQIHFVSALGRSLLELLNPQPYEKILDAGCGTGDLTHAIAQSGSTVLGIDSADSMIDRAKGKYPNLSFEVQDILEYHQPEAFDAVFSNAVFHWIKQPELLVRNIWGNLKAGGRLVAEFGGKNNVGWIVQAIAEELENRGKNFSERNPWYYPSVGEFSTLLEKQGFIVRYTRYFDRLTPLPDQERGLAHWLDMFTSFFFDFSPAEKEEIYQSLEKRLKPVLYREGGWMADFKRLQIVAEKPGHPDR
jgi:trans-aconitate methyltransferase